MIGKLLHLVLNRGGDSACGTRMTLQQIIKEVA
jgi:hypothetical protein